MFIFIDFGINNLCFKDNSKNQARLFQILYQGWGTYHGRHKL